MKMKKLVSSIAVGLGLSMAAAPSFAALEFWSFQDDDIDFALNSDFELKAPGTGQTLEVGDVLVSVFELGTYTINGVNAIPAGQELTGIAVTQILSKDANGDSIEDDWVLGAATGGIDGALEAILGPGSATTILDSNAGDGSILAMFFNSTTGAGGDINLILDAANNPATNCTSLTNCVTQATLGTLLQVDGFLGDGDEFWVADVSSFAGDAANIDDVWNAGVGTQVANINFALSTFYNTVEPVLFQTVNNAICDGATISAVADGCVNVRGNANIIGGGAANPVVPGLSNGAFAHSDADATKFVSPVPEPTTLALAGLGLLGVGLSRRRKA